MTDYFNKTATKLAKTINPGLLWISFNHN